METAQNPAPAADAFCLQAYTVSDWLFGDGGAPAEPISHTQVRQALEHKEEYKPVTIQHGNFATIGPGKTEIKYYTCRESAGSKLPWYALSESTLADLKAQGIGKIVLLYWEIQAKGSTAPTFLCECNLADVEETWSFDNTKYRLNFAKDGATYKVAGKDIRFTRCEKGTRMSGEAGTL